jgi:hypothetical protein
MQQLPAPGGKTKVAMAGTAVVAFLVVQTFAGMAVDLVLTTLTFGIGYAAGKMSK